MMKFVLILVLVFLLSPVEEIRGFGYFDKDEKLDIPFPPMFKKSRHAEIPTGHLRSLGYQRVPDGPVEEVQKSLSGKEFFEEYLSKGTPVTVRNSLDAQSPLMHLWSDEKLHYRHGALQVNTYKRISKGGHEREVQVAPMTLSDFLNTYRQMDLYMSTSMPSEIESEVWVPQFLSCGPQSRSFIEAELWMGFGGTGSLLHYHGYHQVHCVVDGRADFIIMEPKYRDQLKCRTKEHQPQEGYSTIDTELINMYKEAQIADIPWTYTSLKRGDCLFVPAGYLHHARHLGRSLSFSIQFEPSLENSTSDCDTVEDTPKKVLSEFPLIWSTKNNVEQLKNEKLNANDLRTILYLLMQKNDTLTKDGFELFYTLAVKKAGKSPASVEAVFANLDPKQKGFITRKQLKELPDSKLEKVCRILNSVHGKRSVKDEL